MGSSPPGPGIDVDLLRSSTQEFCKSYAGPNTLLLERKCLEFSGSQDRFCLICLQEKPESELFPQISSREIHLCPRRLRKACYWIEPDWRVKSARFKDQIYKRYPGWVSQCCSLCWKRYWDIVSPILGADSPSWSTIDDDRANHLQGLRHQLWASQVDKRDGKFGWRRKVVDLSDDMSLESDRKLIRAIDEVLDKPRINPSISPELPTIGISLQVSTRRRAFDASDGFHVLSQWLIDIFRMSTNEVADTQIESSPCPLDSDMHPEKQSRGKAPPMPSRKRSASSQAQDSAKAMVYSDDWGALDFESEPSSTDHSLIRKRRARRQSIIDGNEDKLPDKGKFPAARRRRKKRTRATPYLNSMQLPRSDHSPMVAGHADSGIVPADADTASSLLASIANEALNRLDNAEQTVNYDDTSLYARHDSPFPECAGSSEILKEAMDVDSTQRSSIANEQPENEPCDEFSSISDIYSHIQVVAKHYGKLLDCTLNELFIKNDEERMQQIDYLADQFYQLYKGNHKSYQSDETQKRLICSLEEKLAAASLETQNATAELHRVAQQLASRQQENQILWDHNNLQTERLAELQQQKEGLAKRLSTSEQSLLQMRLTHDEQMERYQSIEAHYEDTIIELQQRNTKQGSSEEILQARFSTLERSFGELELKNKRLSDKSEKQASSNREMAKDLHAYKIFLRDRLADKCSMAEYNQLEEDYAAFRSDAADMFCQFVVAMNAHQNSTSESGQHREPVILHGDILSFEALDRLWKSSETLERVQSAGLGPALGIDFEPPNLALIRDI